MGRAKGDTDLELDSLQAKAATVFQKSVGFIDNFVPCGFVNVWVLKVEFLCGCFSFKRVNGCLNYLPGL
jgi:hypothetical protein